MEAQLLQNVPRPRLLERSIDGSRYLAMHLQENCSSSSASARGNHSPDSLHDASLNTLNIPCLRSRIGEGCPEYVLREDAARQTKPDVKMEVPRPGWSGLP